MQLLNGEQVIKSWDYAKVKGRFFTKGIYNLTVTNKRLISALDAKNSFTRNEVNLADIKGVSASYSKKGGFFKSLIGIILCCTIILIPIGARLVGKQGRLSIQLCTEVDDYDFINANSITKDSFFSRLFKRSPRMKVYADQAKEIVEQLSSLILGINQA